MRKKADPVAVGEGVEEHLGERLELKAGVGVGREEVLVVLEVVRPDEEKEVSEPDRGGQQGGDEGELERGS